MYCKDIGYHTVSISMWWTASAILIFLEMSVTHPTSNKENDFLFFIFYSSHFFSIFFHFFWINIFTHLLLHGFRSKKWTELEKFPPFSVIFSLSCVDVRFLVRSSWLTVSSYSSLLAVIYAITVSSELSWWCDVVCCFLQLHSLQFTVHRSLKSNPPFSPVDNSFSSCRNSVESVGKIYALVYRVRELTRLLKSVLRNFTI